MHSQPLCYSFTASGTESFFRTFGTSFSTLEGRCPSIYLRKGRTSFTSIKLVAKGSAKRESLTPHSESRIRGAKMRCEGSHKLENRGLGIAKECEITHSGFVSSRFHCDSQTPEKKRACGQESATAGLRGLVRLFGDRDRRAGWAHPQGDPWWCARWGCPPPACAGRRARRRWGGPRGWWAWGA